MRMEEFRIQRLNSVDLYSMFNQNISVTVNNTVVKQADSNEYLVTSTLEIFPDQEEAKASDEGARSFISAEFQSRFSYNPNDEIPDPEVRDVTFVEVFPHIRAIISSVTALLGPQALFLPSPFNAPTPNEEGQNDRHN